MTVQKDQPGLVANRLAHCAFEVSRLETGVAVNSPLTGLRRDHLVNHRGLASPACGGSIQSEAKILLTIAADQVRKEVARGTAVHGDRVFVHDHCVAHNWRI